MDKRTRQLSERTLGRLRGAIAEHIETRSSIYTDALKSYRGLTLEGFIHYFIDHAEAYPRGAVHTNGLENFRSLMKRSLKGTYVSVEPFRLWAYADEQAFSL
jgi:transposase-like protein